MFAGAVVVLFPAERVVVEFALSYVTKACVGNFPFGVLVSDTEKHFDEIG